MIPESAKRYVRSEMKKYIEPVRKGRAKGDIIGHSPKHMEALIYMTIVPLIKRSFISKETGVATSTMKVIKCTTKQDLSFHIHQYEQFKRALFMDKMRGAA